MNNRDRPTVDRLAGTWVSERIKTEWGTAIFELTFERNGDLIFSMLSPAGTGQGLSRKGKCRLTGGQMVSDIFDQGRPAAISFDGQDLIIDTASEPPWRFKRK